MKDKKVNMNRLLTLSIAFLALASCRQQQPPHPRTPVPSPPRAPAPIPANAPTRSLSRLHDATFQTMGKAVASRYADVKFEAALPVLRVLVHNGDHVRQGQLLAELDSYQYANAVEQHQKEIDQAHLQMQDVIISQGFDPEQMDRVPPHVRHTAEVKSGFLLAQSKLAAARHELAKTRVLAPFEGVVANVKARSGQLAQIGEAVCRVIAERPMDVEFRVMESDLGLFPKGATLLVLPVADQSSAYEASVAEINPMVDEQGTVLIRARVASPTPQSLRNSAPQQSPTPLFDGMHVSVIIKAQPRTSPPSYTHIKKQP